MRSGRAPLIVPDRPSSAPGVRPRADDDRSPQRGHGSGSGAATRGAGLGRAPAPRGSARPVRMRTRSPVRIPPARGARGLPGSHGELRQRRHLAPEPLAGHPEPSGRALAAASPEMGIIPGARTAGRPAFRGRLSGEGGEPDQRQRLAPEPWPDIPQRLGVVLPHPQALSHASPEKPTPESRRGGHQPGARRAPPMAQRHVLPAAAHGRGRAQHTGW